MAVDGVGAVALAVPPVAVVYQFSTPPAAGVAVNALAVAFKQYTTGVVTNGAAGNGLTVTVIRTVSEQPDEFVSITWRVAFPTLVHVTEIEFVVAPVIVPLPPVTGVMVHRYVDPETDVTA